MDSKEKIVITGWSIKKSSGISLITLCTAIELAKRLENKKILWMTTSAQFCPAERALALKCDKDQKTIDIIIENVSNTNSDELNKVIIEGAMAKVEKIKNLSILLESNTQDSDYIKDNIKNFKSVIFPKIKNNYDIVIVDTAGYFFSEVSTFIIKNSDLVLNILTQNSVALDEYVKRKPEITKRVRDRINILNKVRNIQPDAKTIRREYEEDIIEIRDHDDFISVCNTGHLLNYLGQKTNEVTQDLAVVIDSIIDKYKLKPPIEEKEKIIQPAKRKGFMRIFRFASSN